MSCLKALSHVELQIHTIADYDLALLTLSVFQSDETILALDDEAGSYKGKLHAWHCLVVTVSHPDPVSKTRFTGYCKLPIIIYPV